MAKIAIVGMGLIGTSLGLALREQTAKGLELVGTDKEYDHAIKAQKMGAIDKATRALRDAVDDAAMVIIATPLLAIREILEAIGPRLRPGCVVTDTGSTKGVVLQWAAEYLPSEVSFVGGHPLTGKETSGPEAAEAALFQDKLYCVIPSPSAQKEAVKSVIDLVSSIGAKPYFVDPVEHDSYIAAVSHLPLLLSVALVGTVSKSPGWGDLAQVASSGFRDISRLASGDPVMGRDICVTNPDNIVHWIDAFIKELYEFRSLIQSDGEELVKAFDNAWEARERWLAGKVSIGARPTPGVEVPSFTDRVGEMFIGHRLMEMQKRMMKDTRRTKEGKDKGTQGS
ncbi:MAG: prephenate dehydrogenase [Dehalococcoidia bacterium]